MSNLENKKTKGNLSQNDNNKVKKRFLSSIPIFTSLVNLGMRFISVNKNAESKKQGVESINKTIEDNLKSINKTIDNNLKTNDNITCYQELTEERITLNHSISEESNKNTPFELEEFIGDQESSSLEDLDIDFLCE